MGFQEPMPDFDSRYEGRLESCLEQPFAKFSGVIFYRGLLKKAVALFYFCIKDHPFENGNKRFAVIVMIYFLLENECWLNIDPVMLYKLAKAVAEDDDRPEVVIGKVSRAFKPYLKQGDPRQ